MITDKQKSWLTANTTIFLLKKNKEKIHSAHVWSVTMLQWWKKMTEYRSAYRWGRCSCMSIINKISTHAWQHMTHHILPSQPQTINSTQLPRTPSGIFLSPTSALLQYINAQQQCRNSIYEKNQYGYKTGRWMNDVKIGALHKPYSK